MTPNVESLNRLRTIVFKLVDSSSSSVSESLESTEQEQETVTGRI